MVLAVKYSTRSPPRRGERTHNLAVTVETYGHINNAGCEGIATTIIVFAYFCHTVPKFTYFWVFGTQRKE